MHISKRGEYGFRALIDIGLAHELGRELVPLGELAKNGKIPQKFLEQILLALREGAFLASVRGKYGGYKLARPAHEIYAGQVVRYLDGPLAPIGCVSQSAYERCSCPDEVHCGLRMLMLDVRNSIAHILDRYTLADVVAVTLRKMRRDNVCLPFAASPPRGVGSASTKKHVKPASVLSCQPPTSAPAAFETGLGEFLYCEGI